MCVVPGGKPIIFFPMLALIEEGDEVIYPNPGFPIYESMIRFLGGVPVPMPLVEVARLLVRPGSVAIQADDRTKLVILNSPQNPTGGVIPREDIAAIAETGPRSRHDGAVGRDLLAHLLRRAAGVDRQLSRACRRRRSFSTDFRRSTR